MAWASMLVIFSKQIESYIVFLGWGVALLLGLFLFMLQTPGSQRYRNFNTAKRLTATVYLLFAAEMLFQWLLHFSPTVDPVVSLSFYLGIFYVAIFLLAFAFVKLLLPHALMRRTVVRYSIVVAIYLLLLLVTVCLPQSNFRIQLVLGCAVILFITVCYLIYKSIGVYRLAIHDLRLYYSDYVEVFGRWMPGVMAGVLLFALTSPIVSVAPRLMGIVQVILSIPLFVYTFITLMRFAFYYASLSEDSAAEASAVAASASRGDASPMLSPSLVSVIDAKRQQWQQAGGYRTKGLTLGQAARDMGTNRTYLSQYLNEVCHTTFYEWIRDLRLDEARTLLTTTDLPVEQVATQVGFASSNNFSTTFRQQMGMTPIQWRRKG